MNTVAIAKSVVNEFIIEYQERGWINKKGVLYFGARLNQPLFCLTEREIIKE